MGWPSWREGRVGREDHGTASAIPFALEGYASSRSGVQGGDGDDVTHDLRRNNALVRRHAETFSERNKPIAFGFEYADRVR